MRLLLSQWCFSALLFLPFGLRSSAQDVDVCPDGWAAVSNAFLKSRLESNLEQAVAHVLPQEQKAWMEWQQWSAMKLKTTIMALPEEVQARHKKETERDIKRLEVSNYTCQQKDDGSYSVRVDPDGRSYQFLTLCQHENDWRVSTGIVALDLESIEMVKAYMMALDARSWEEAEAWVAQAARPRFAWYRNEVEMFLSSSAMLQERRAVQAKLRIEEWPNGQMRAERLSEDMLEVKVEFPTAASFACELVQVENTWRVLLR